MKDHSNCRRAFIWDSRAYYGKYFEGESVTFGMFAPGGGTSGEMSMKWIWLGGENVPMLQVFNDAWDVLSTFGDLIARLAEVDSKRITAQEFVDILLECDFIDDTKYEKEEK